MTSVDTACQFPSTHATWIVESLGDGDAGLQQAQRHIMERYRAALTIYAAALPARSVAEPSELVAGFFARRVGNPTFFAAWRESGLPLRRYLMNGLSLDARTLLRSERREAERRRRYAAEEAAGGATFVDATLVDATLVDARRSNPAEEEERLVEARLAEERLVEARLAEERLIEERLAVVSRRVGRRMRAALREVLSEEGVSAAELEHELRLVLARLRA